MKSITILVASILIFGCGMDKDNMLQHGQKIVSALEKLQSQKKFTAYEPIFYPGAPDEATRIKAELIINQALSKLITASANPVTERYFWSVLESAALELAEMDSEEMDRGMTYMEEIMNVYDIESSEGRLDKWRYGFEPKDSH